MAHCCRAWQTMTQRNIWQRVSAAQQGQHHAWERRQSTAVQISRTMQVQVQEVQVVHMRFETCAAMHSPSEQP